MIDETLAEAFAEHIKPAYVVIQEKMKYAEEKLQDASTQIYLSTSAASVFLSEAEGRARVQNSPLHKILGEYK